MAKKKEEATQEEEKSTQKPEANQKEELASLSAQAEELDEKDTDTFKTIFGKEVTLPKPKTKKYHDSATNMFYVFAYNKWQYRTRQQIFTDAKDPNSNLVVPEKTGLDASKLTSKKK